MLEDLITNMDLQSVRNAQGGRIQERNPNPFQVVQNARQVARVNPIDYLFSHQSSSASLDSADEARSLTLQGLSQLAGLRTPPESASADSNDWRQRLRTQLFPPNRNHLILSAPPPIVAHGWRPPADYEQRAERAHERTFFAQQRQQMHQEHVNQFKTKTVCELECKSCFSNVCNRGMRAILLANSKVELYSTDAPPPGVSLVAEDYTTSSCRCKVKDVACLGCGNVIGYHVTSPCERCLDACNNGHFWMFHSDGVGARERRSTIGNIILWANLPGPEKDKKLADDTYDRTCR